MAGGTGGERRAPNPECPFDAGPQRDALTSGRASLAAIVGDGYTCFTKGGNNGFHSVTQQAGSHWTELKDLPLDRAELDTDRHESLVNLHVSQAIEVSSPARKEEPHDPPRWTYPYAGRKDLQANCSGLGRCDLKSVIEAAYKRRDDGSGCVRICHFTLRLIGSQAQIVICVAKDEPRRERLTAPDRDGSALATQGGLEPGSAPYRATIASRLRDGRVPSNASLWTLIGRAAWAYRARWTRF